MAEENKELRGRVPDRLPEPQENTLTEIQRSLLKRVEAGRGRVPTPYKVWIQSPAVAGPLHELGAALSKSISLSKREREIAILLMARHWQAEYVFEVHVREAMEAGLRDVDVADIRAGSPPKLDDPRERSVCAIVRDFAQSASSNDEVFNDAVAALGQNGLAELLVLCGYFTSVSLAMKLYRVRMQR